MSYKVKIAKQYAQRATSIVRLFAEYIVSSIRQAFNVLPYSEKKILFTLDDDRLYRNDDGSGRYAYLIMRAFSDAGYSVYFYKKVGFGDFVRLRRYGRMIYSIKNLKVTANLPARTDDIIYAFDTAYKHMLARPWKKLSYVNVLKPTFCKVGELIPIPYFLHGRMYQVGQSRRVENYRGNERKLRVLFGGNLSKGYYSNPDVKKYGQLTRLEAVETLLEKGSKIKFWNEPGEFCEFIANLKTYVNECHIVKTNETFPINPKKWFDILASGDFFLCFSGTDLPMCHNAIEAMAVGTIPIIGYPDWFFPTLEHRKNAIVYSGKEDLIKKVKEVLEMDSAEIAQMRQNAGKYYDQYLSTSSFIKRSESSDSKINTLMLHPRLIGTAKENEDGQALLKELEGFLGKGEAKDADFFSQLKIDRMSDDDK